MTETTAADANPPPVHPDLFVSIAGGETALLGMRCEGCQRCSFPRADVCCWCGHDDVTSVTLSSRATLWGWAEVHTPPPGYHGAVPYGMGVAELPEGIRVVTRVEIDQPHLLRFGAPVRFVTTEVAADDGSTRLTWSVEPLPASVSSRTEPEPDAEPEPEPTTTIDANR